METYHGHVRTPVDAVILFEACRLGLLPRVQRRLSEKERQSIKSGSIFVWDEREAGMRRWTDGKSWSASRVSGSFLTYREMEGKRGGGSAFAPPVTTSSHTRKSPTADSDSDHMDVDGPDGYRYKPDGLMKQSFSITTATHQKLHLISYYARSHPTSMNLMQPSQDPQLKLIRPQKGMYPESTVHEQQNVPVMSHSNNNQRQTGSPYHSHTNNLSSQSYRPPQPATHPHSYSQSPNTSTYQQQQWLPSPTNTPPMLLAAIIPPQYHQQLPPVFPSQQGQLPPPISTVPNGNGVHYIPTSSVSYMEGSPQLQAVRRSPMFQLRSLQQPTPSMSQEFHLPRQQSIPPSEYPGSIRYSSPGACSHTSGHTPPSVIDNWEMNPIRRSPEILGQSLGFLQGDRSPRSRPVVQDIPTEKIPSNEDVRALRILDKAFVA